MIGWMFLEQPLIVNLGPNCLFLEFLAKEANFEGKVEKRLVLEKKMFSNFNSFCRKFRPKLHSFNHTFLGKIISVAPLELSVKRFLTNYIERFKNPGN